MAPSQILPFLMARPSVPFRATLVGGREISVPHSDFAVPAQGALGFWMLHDSGHVEAIAVEAIISMISLNPIDPHDLTG